MTIADLDEALFSLANVLDFAMTVSREGARDCLRLEVKAVDGMDDYIAGAIDAALESIPAIQLARTSGQLDVVVAAQTIMAEVVAVRHGFDTGHIRSLSAHG